MSPRSFHDGPVVVITGRVAAMLEHHLEQPLTDLRQRYRGKDAELDDALLGLHTAAVMFLDDVRDGVSSADGTQRVPIAEPPAQSTVMSVTDVSDLVDLEPRTVRKAALEGRLDGRKIAGVWQFTSADVAAWRATRARGAAA